MDTGTFRGIITGILIIAFTGEKPDYTEQADGLTTPPPAADTNQVGGLDGSGTDATTRAEARFQYRPDARRILNVAYRFRQGALEQGDMSFAWPAGGRWSFVGRYNYSFRENANLERFAGVEYEACCWRLRLVGRRYISRRTGESDSSLALQPAGAAMADGAAMVATARPPRSEPAAHAPTIRV